MDLGLRSFQARDLDLLPVWSQALGLDRYMSRCRPRDPMVTGHDPAHGLLWYVIVVDGMDAGTLWLEPGAHSSQAVLGILLGREDLLGQGFGSRAIGLAIGALRELCPIRAQVVLNVRESNARAIACYRSCGFQAIATTGQVMAGGKVIPVLRMRLDLGMDPRGSRGPGSCGASGPAPGNPGEPAPSRQEFRFWLTAALGEAKPLAPGDGL